MKKETLEIKKDLVGRPVLADESTEIVDKEAAEFANQQALNDYLKKHPGANKMKHKVVNKRYEGGSKNKLHIINDAETKNIMQHLDNKLKGLVTRDEKKPNELNFVNYDARRKALDIIHQKGLHKFLMEEKTATVEKGWKGTAKAMKKHKEIDNSFSLTNWMAKQKKGDPWGLGGKLKKKPESHYTEKGKKKKSSFDDEKIINEIVSLQMK